MNAFASYFNYSLGENEYISDVIDPILDIPCGNTLIQAGTGFGKTTLIVDSLMLTDKVIFLSPSVAQVTQLSAKCAGRTDIVFLSGASTKQPIDESLIGKNIVCTYDKFSHIRKAFGDVVLKDYTLIVDELHKLYAAGSYRDPAINPILKVVQNNIVFKRQVYLTATFTEKLANLAKIKIDRVMQFSKETALQRHIIIRTYQHKGSSYWIQAVSRRLALNKGQLQHKIVLVRLNSCKKRAALQAFFEALKYKVLFISSDQMGHIDIQEALRNESLPMQYDLIITTSVLDEAVNFDNTNDQIDSVHFVNATAHPEEIIQFAGRLRKATPPIFIHLQNSSLLFKEPVAESHNPTIIADAVQQELLRLDAMKYQSEMSDLHCKNFTAIETYYDGITAHCLVFKNSTRFANKRVSKKDRHEFVAKMNQTCKEILDCRFLSVDNKSVIGVNYASLLANCYRKDIHLIHKNVEYLGWRLQQLLPSVLIEIEDVRAIDCDQVDLDNLDKEIKRLNKAHKLRLKQALSDVHEKVRIRWVDYYPDSNLEDFGRNQINEVDGSVNNIYSRVTEPEHHVQYEKFVKLTAHLNKLNEIHDVMQFDGYDQIVSLSRDYKDNLIVQNLQHFIQIKLTEHRSQYGVEQNLRIDRDLAVNLVNSALTKTAQDVPDITQIIKRMAYSGVTYDQQRNHSEVLASKAFNMIKKFCDTKDFNSHKPENRYLMLKGVYHGGYSFRSDPASRSEKLLKDKDDKRIEDL